MSFSKEVTIWCDSCSRWEMFNYAETGGTVPEARRLARRMGWRTADRAGRKDLCPACVMESLGVP